MSTNKFTVETTIAADPEKVWEYWTQPEHITNWNYATDDWHCTKADNDLRVGGRYSSRMEAKDGSFGFDFEAVYDEVVDQKKLVYTLTDGRQATTDFKDLGGQTRVTATFDAEEENPVDVQKEGWQSILNNFKKYTESN